MEKIVTVDPDVPLDQIGWHILDQAGVNMARVAVSVRAHGTDATVTTMLTYLADMQIQLVTTGGTPYDPAEAVRAAVAQVAPA